MQQMDFHLLAPIRLVVSMNGEKKWIEKGKIPSYASINIFHEILEFRANIRRIALHFIRVFFVVLCSVINTFFAMKKEYNGKNDTKNDIKGKMSNTI